MAEQYGRLVWTGLRQLQALRDAVTWSLGGNFGFQPSQDEFALLDKTTIGQWLETQGLPVVSSGESDLSLTGMIAAAINGHVLSLAGPSATAIISHGRRATHQDVKDFGTERSGAGWSDAANFCITSAFLRLLGAWEQFELDVLKSLFYYRPSGESPGPQAEQIVIEPELEVVYEEPVRDPKHPEKLNYSFPPEWTQQKKEAENNVTRSMIFSRKYDVVTIHGGPDKKKLKENRKLRDDWYESRNAIAHGRKQVTMTLAEYAEVEVFVYLAMAHVAEQCFEKHKLLV